MKKLKLKNGTIGLNELNFCTIAIHKQYDLYKPQKSISMTDGLKWRSILFKYNRRTYKKYEFDQSATAINLIISVFDTKRFILPSQSSFYDVSRSQ